MSGVHPQITQRHKKEFLENFEAGRYICAAAKKTGVHVSQVWRWRQEDEAFRKLFDETRILAEQHIIAKLEDEADRRGMKSSDTLLIFRLKALAPDKYRERLEHSGPGGGPLEVVVKWDGNRGLTPPNNAQNSEK